MFSRSSGVGKESKEGLDENAINASISHVVLCCVAGQGIGQMQGFNFTQPGFHGNLFLFGLLGYLNSQKARINLNVTELYAISTKATRFLALPCVMADLNKNNYLVASAHILSGLVPFTISLIKPGDHFVLGNLVLAANILALGHHSLENNSEWGCYTAGAAILTYYLTPQVGTKIIYPFALALMEYCAYRTFKVKLARKKIILNCIIAVMLIVDQCGC